MSKIFVFGSNLAGRHGKGAAKTAVDQYGAIYGQSEGLQGQSYGIPTKDSQLMTLPLERVKNGVDQFLAFARSHPELQFFVTRIGCGLAGYTDDDIGPMFAKAPDNCELPQGWREAYGAIYFQSRGAQEYRFLSNFWLAPIIIKSYYAGLPRGQREKTTVYPTSEHMYQSLKAVSHEDMERIRLAGSPSEAKKLGSQIELNPQWEEMCEYHATHTMKVCVMLDTLRLKFGQNLELRQKLLATGNRELIEYAPWGDVYWGVDKSLKGNNMLGKLIMKVRDELRKK